MKKRSKKIFFFYIDLDTIMSSLDKLNRTLNVRNTKIGLYFIFILCLFLFLELGLGISVISQVTVIQSYNYML